MVYYFAVWEARDGRHDGYVDHSPVNAPLMSEHAVGFKGCATFREACESVKRHRETPCDGSCAEFLARRDDAARKASGVRP